MIVFIFVRQEMKEFYDKYTGRPELWTEEILFRPFPLYKDKPIEVASICFYRILFQSKENIAKLTEDMFLKHKTAPVAERRLFYHHYLPLP